MSEFKEFQGKNLDEAISNACDYFNLNRDKLEIEILSGGSTGVFGLVGKKNAKVKARPRGGDKKNLLNEESRKGRPRQERRDRVQDRAPHSQDLEKPVVPAEKEESIPAVCEESAAPAVKPEAELAVKEEGEVAVKPEAEVAVREEESPVADVSEGEPVDGASLDVDDENDDENDEEEYVPQRSIMEGDPEEIAEAVREALEMMIEPIIQAKPKLEIEVGEDRVNVLVDDEENSGLIIGREGQTLSSLQYLCNRMVSKKLQTSVRVQIDTGDYRERQDEKLRQLAWHLADKAMHTGRVQSTKPLSSYHRRVVHMALQEDKYVNTRSKGEGPMKRVLILPRRSRGGGGGGARRNDNYQKNDRYNSRGSDSGRGYSNNRRNDSYNKRNRDDNYGGRRNDNYGDRRNDNYGSRRNDNYGDRRNDNFGNRSYDENAGNRYNDNFGNRQPRQNNRRNDRYKEGGPDGFNSERYNRY